ARSRAPSRAAPTGRWPTRRPTSRPAARTGARRPRAIGAAQAAWSARYARRQAASRGSATLRALNQVLLAQGAAVLVQRTDRVLEAGVADRATLVQHPRQDEQEDGAQREHQGQYQHDDVELQHGEPPRSLRRSHGNPRCGAPAADSVSAYCL